MGLHDQGAVEEQAAGVVLAAQRPRRPRGSHTGVWSWVVGLGSGDLQRLELRQEQGTPLGSSSVSW